MTRLKIGVVGLSRRGWDFAEYFLKNDTRFELVAIHDLLHARMEMFQKRHDCKAKLCGSVDELMADRSVAAVMVATVDVFHPEIVLKALQAGKHVFCEKPMAITIEDCDRIVQAVRKSDKLFYMGFNLRWSPVYEKAKELIEAGEVGKIHTLQFSEYYHGGRTYFRRWNRLRKYGGGLWVTKATHDFDIMRFLCGKRPLRVTGTCNLFHYKPDPRRGRCCRECNLIDECPDYWNVLAEQEWAGFLMTQEKTLGWPVDVCPWNSEKDTFDHGIALIEYEDGVIGSYTLSVVTAISNRTFSIQGDRASMEGDLEKGTVIVTERFTDRRSTHDVSAQTKGGHGGADNRLIEDFRLCALTRKKPRADYMDGRLSVQTGLLVREACDQGGVWMDVKL